MRIFQPTISGSAVITGSLIVTGSISSTLGFTGSIQGSSSYALTASYALNGGTGGASFPYTGSAIISGSLIVTGSINASSGFTGSLLGSASYSITSSYATITEQIGVTFDGQSSNISSTSTGYYRTTYPFTITNYYIDANNSGSIQFDLRVNGTSIVVPGGNLPTLTSAPSSSAAIASWATSSLTAGTLIQYVITGSAPTVTWSKLTLAIKRT